MQKYKKKRRCSTSKLRYAGITYFVSVLMNCNIDGITWKCNRKMLEKSILWLSAIQHIFLFEVKIRINTLFYFLAIFEFD
jgi:hypothetical protein